MVMRTRESFSGLEVAFEYEKLAKPVSRGIFLSNGHSYFTTTLLILTGNQPAVVVIYSFTMFLSGMCETRPKARVNNHCLNATKAEEGLCHLLSLSVSKKGKIYSYAVFRSYANTNTGRERDTYTNVYCPFALIINAQGR